MGTVGNKGLPQPGLLGIRTKLEHDGIEPVETARSSHLLQSDVDLAEGKGQFRDSGGGPAKLDPHEAMAALQELFTLLNRAEALGKELYLQLDEGAPLHRSAKSKLSGVTKQIGSKLQLYNDALAVVESGLSDGDLAAIGGATARACDALDLVEAYPEGAKLGLNEQLVLQDLLSVTLQAPPAIEAAKEVELSQRGPREVAMAMSLEKRGLRGPAAKILSGCALAFKDQGVRLVAAVLAAEDLIAHGAMANAHYFLLEGRESLRRLHKAETPSGALFEGGPTLDAIQSRLERVSEIYEAYEGKDVDGYHRVPLRIDPGNGEVLPNRSYQEIEALGETLFAEHGSEALVEKSRRALSLGLELYALEERKAPEGEIRRKQTEYQDAMRDALTDMAPFRQAMLDSSSLTPIEVRTLAERVQFSPEVPEEWHKGIDATLREYLLLTNGRDIVAINEFVRNPAMNAHHDTLRGSINVNPPDPLVMMHEFFHSAELSSEIEAANRSWQERFGYEPVRFGVGEQTKLIKGDFARDYVGTRYRSGSTEVSSTGGEHFANAEAMVHLLGADRSQFMLVLGQMRA